MAVKVTKTGNTIILNNVYGTSEDVYLNASLASFSEVSGIFKMYDGINRIEHVLGVFSNITDFLDNSPADNDAAIDFLATIARQSDVDVFIQDQTTQPFQYYLMREDKTDITLTSDITSGDNVISVSAGHGFTGGEYISLFENNQYYQSKVVSVSVNDLTLQAPVFYAFTSAGTVAVRGSIDMDVDGSVTPQNFLFKLRDFTTPIDIQFVHITIWNAAAAGDDGTFGDLSELTNGLLFTKENSSKLSLGNFTVNSGFGEYGADIEYHTRAGGGGTYGIDVDFEIKKTYGIVIRVNGRVNDIIKGAVRDNLSTLGRLRISLMGQYTSGE